MTFESSALRFGSRGALAVVEGDLTAHGATRSVTLDVTQFKCAEHPLLKKPWCGAEAAATIRRSEFGMNAFAAALPDKARLVQYRTEEERVLTSP